MIVGSTPALASFVRKRFERLNGSSFFSFSYFRSRGWTKSSKDDSLPGLQLQRIPISGGDSEDKLNLGDTISNDKIAFTTYVDVGSEMRQNKEGGIMRTFDVEQTSRSPKAFHEMV